MTTARTVSDADRNWRRFVLFRVLFNSRFYYPVLAVLFLDLGLSATEYTMLNFAWALAIVFTDLPAGVLADRIGRKPLVVAGYSFSSAAWPIVCSAAWPRAWPAGRMKRWSSTRWRNEVDPPSGLWFWIK